MSALTAVPAYVNKGRSTTSPVMRCDRLGHLCVPASCTITVHCRQQRCIPLLLLLCCLQPWHLRQDLIALPFTKYTHSSHDGASITPQSLSSSFTSSCCSGTDYKVVAVVSFNNVEAALLTVSASFEAPQQPALTCTEGIGH